VLPVEKTGEKAFEYKIRVSGKIAHYYRGEEKKRKLPGPACVKYFQKKPVQKRNLER